MLVPAISLGVCGWVQLRDGMAVDAAIPVPVYMVARIPMPRSAYVEAAAALERADRRNGSATIEAAEAHMHAGLRGPAVAAELRRGLSHQPASARGWTLLAEAASDRAQAAKALKQALALAPRDYWLIGARAEDAGLLWSDLDADGRDTVLAQARMLWSEPMLHGQLRSLLESRGGAVVVSHAFGPEELRAVNRWHSREVRRRAKR